MCNCEKQSSIKDEQTAYETVGLNEAIRFFNSKKTSLYTKSSNKDYVIPDMDKITQEEIINSSELLTVIPATTKYENINSRILLLKVNREIESVVINMHSNKVSENNLFSGEITIVSLEGIVLRGFKIQDGIVIKSYQSDSSNIGNKNNKNKSTADDSSECRQWCGHEASDPTCICNIQILNEIEITASQNTSISYLRIADLYDLEGGNCDINCDGWDFGGGGFSTDDPAQTKKPCVGDPVANPEIAPQANSGVDGGLYGTCTRLGRVCHGTPGVRPHDGIDLKNAYGEPVYAMYDGIARLATQTNKLTGKVDGAGYHVSITSTINGQSLRLVYFHLQENNRIAGEVKAGDIIGYQGDSGNLKAAIEQKLTESHVHIKARLNGVTANPLDYLKTKIDPITGQITLHCQ